jgi:hypothetical protein
MKRRTLRYEVLDGDFFGGSHPMPDRLPSLIVLAGFWVPPALAGWVAASSLRGRATRGRESVTYPKLAAYLLGYAAMWFVFNLKAMPPYIPGATRDPTVAPPRAIAWLALVAIGVVLPGSALACALSFRRRSRMLRR